MAEFRFEVVRLAAMQELEDRTELTFETSSAELVTLTFRRDQTTALAAAALTALSKWMSPTKSE